MPCWNDVASVLAPVHTTSPKDGSIPKDEFAIDLESDTVTCPRGKTAPIYKPRRNRPSATGERVARFARSDCEPCPPRARCSPTGRRDIRISRREDLRQAALRRLSDPAEHDHLKCTRPLIERLLGLIVHRYGGITEADPGSQHHAKSPPVGGRAARAGALFSGLRRFQRWRRCRRQAGATRTVRPARACGGRQSCSSRAKRGSRGAARRLGRCAGARAGAQRVAPAPPPRSSGRRLRAPRSGRGRRHGVRRRAPPSRR
jgi:Transposase DDE domain